MANRAAAGPCGGGARSPSPCSWRSSSSSRRARAPTPCPPPAGARPLRSRRPVPRCPRPRCRTPSPPPDRADVPYGTTADAATVLDVYLPRAGPAEGRPAVLTVHGGGWVGGERSRVAGDAWAFAQAGVVAFNVGYRVAGPDRWPTELLDVQQALRWVQANASTYGVDPARIGLFGSSAGGNLALLAGATDGGDPTRLGEGRGLVVRADRPGRPRRCRRARLGPRRPGAGAADRSAAERLCR
ncbi:MAG: alpha/beta hydrolase [Acidimicrobiales bacterium]